MTRFHQLTLLVALVLSVPGSALAQYQDQWLTPDQQGQGQQGSYGQQGSFDQQPTGHDPAASTTGAEPATPRGFLPVAQAERPLTLTAMTLRIDGDFSIARICIPTGFAGTVCDTAVGFAAGAGFGIIDDFEVGAVVLPLQLSPDFDYGNPSLYARFRFLDADVVEMGVEAQFVIPRFANTGVLIVGVLMRFHFGSFARLDTGAFVRFAFADSVGVGLMIPAEFLFNATPNLFFALATGFGIGNFEAPGDTIFVPLGLRAGWTVDVNNSPLVDIYGSFGWPTFVTSGGGDAINADFWAIGIGADFYLNFGG